MTYTRMFRGNPLLRKKRVFYILSSFSLAVFLATFHRIVHYKFRPSFLREVFDRPAKKYDHLRPLREMFANASKVTYTGQRSNHEPSQSTPMFQLSDLHEVDNKVSILLLVIVTTAPLRYGRREAIRATWWKKCDGIEIQCKFFTDGLQLSHELERKLATEQKSYGDIEFQALESTRIFGLRFLYHIMWATAKFNFVYLLRVDDDNFVCLERLKTELFYRPTQGLIWGSYHCSYRDLIYVDEAWILFTSDIIERFLSQDPHSILCHPHADQQIPVWINKLYTYNESLFHFDDRRIHRYPPAKTLKKFNNLYRVCDSYVGVHGSSPKMMLNFGHNSKDGPKSNSSLNLTPVTETCRFPNIFNISKIIGPYKFELRPCLTNPRWTPKEQMWLGIHSGGKIKT